jgi:uncharacterized protein YlaN (UPF0358 family)
MLNRLVLCSLLAVAGNAHAGTVLEMINRDLTNKTEGLSTTYAQKGLMRIETGGANDAFAIFRDETIYTFDPKKKTYVAMDRATMQRLASQLNPALKMIQEQMANMSPEQRAQMERMLGTKMPGAEKELSEEIRKTSRTATVAGHPCTYSEILQDGVMQTEVCIVPVDKLNGGKELFEVAVKVGALVKDMMAAVDSPWIKQMVNREMENFDKLGGVPVKSRTFDQGNPVHEATLKSIRTEALAATLFEIPASYKKQDLPSMTP